MVLRRFAIYTLGLGMMAGLATATTVYSDAATFDAAAATAGLTLNAAITFDGDTCSLCTSLTDSGVLFTSSQMNIVSPSGWADGNVLARPTPGGSISIAPSTSYFAFALNIVTISSGGFPIDVTFNDGSSQDLSLTTNSSAGHGFFVGAISTAPITNLQVAGFPSFLVFGLDDFQTDSGAAAPDVPTMLLMGGGLIALHLLQRRRQVLAG